MGKDEGNPAGGDVAGGVDARLQAALAGMEGLRQVLQRRLDELNGTPAEMLKAAGLDTLQRDLSRAVQGVVAEEGKLQDVLDARRGGGGGDLDGLRAEVRRRLDRIRKHITPGGVP